MVQRRTKPLTRKGFLSACLLFAWSVQIATPQSLEAIQDRICRSISGINEDQIQLCKEVPKAINVLTATEKVFASECAWQFRKELWNCSGAEMPVFNTPRLSDTKEAGFVYALTSALTVHQVTTACSNNTLGSVCGCDRSRNGQTTVQGWKWGACSDNVSYGITYAQNFLDSRELERTASPHHDEISMAAVHLHNNGAGRRVVQDGMKTACRCHGFSGSCSVKTCWRELPSVFEIGDSVKGLYDQAIKVELNIPRNGGEATLYYVKNDSNETPSSNQMVYTQPSPRYCDSKSNFTINRQCMPNATLAGQFHNTAMDEFYPPCETFCCNGEYKTYHKKEVTSCNCTFVWCCEVVCQECVRNVTEHRCTS